jgi:hypothetical protein
VSFGLLQPEGKPQPFVQLPSVRRDLSLPPGSRSEERAPSAVPAAAREHSGRRIRHVGYYWILPAERHLHGVLFGQMLPRICAAGTERLHSDCGYKIWRRGRMAGAVSEEPITRHQPGLVRRKKNELLEPRGSLGPAVSANSLCPGQEKRLGESGEVSISTSPPCS